MKENSGLDKKSLITITKTNPDWKEIAKDCVCFANAQGGVILIGIEDDDTLPPPNQIVPPELPGRLLKNIQGNTVNVGVTAVLKTGDNGGQYIELKVSRSATTIAATSTGKYYLRIDDECKPLLPDELSRLLTDKQAFSWELLKSVKVLRSEHDTQKMSDFMSDLQMSGRVSEFVKSKSADELMDYYLFADGEYLTNLGVLWIGRQVHRAKLLYSPSVQFIKWNEQGQKVNKLVWDDFSLNPKELLSSIWNSISDFKEGIEIEDGLFRKKIFHYDEVVIRELIVNALVHRPYTTRGDIFINLYPTHVEIHNPGQLPLGVTPENILHRTVQRNPHLAKIFYDLKLMEKEGSGYDTIYQTLLLNGKQLPETIEQSDRVVVKVSKQIVKKEIIHFLEKVSKEFSLSSKEVISLGVIAQHQSLTAIEFGETLGLEEPNAIRSWLGKLLEYRIIKTKGKTKGTTYFIEQALLRKMNFKGKTNLKNIEPHRLDELIRKDLEIYGKSGLTSIHERVVPELNKRKLSDHLTDMVLEGKIKKEGVKKGTVYFL